MKKMWRSDTKKEETERKNRSKKDCLVVEIVESFQLQRSEFKTK